MSGSTGKRVAFRQNGLVVAGLAGLLLAGCSGNANRDAVGWYGEMDTGAPRADRVIVCHGFGCNRRTAVQFTAADLRRVEAMMRPGRASPEAERTAVARVVAWAEKRVAPTVGSQDDVGGLDLGNNGVPGQMDCLDEATNTTSYMLVLAENALLRHHRVGRPVARGFFLDGRYPHATATLIEMESGTAWAIDSWPEANGVKPDVKLLDAWMAASPARG